MCCVHKALMGTALYIQRAGPFWVEISGYEDARQRELKIVQALQPRV